MHEAMECEWHGTLDELQHHLSQQCGFVVVDCPFKPHGCAHSCARREMALHHAHAGNQHAEHATQRLEALSSASSELEKKHAQRVVRVEDLAGKGVRIGNKQKVMSIQQEKMRQRAVLTKRRVVRPPGRQRIVLSDEEEQDEEDLAPLPQLPQPVTTGIEDDVGWTEVKRKSYKTKRELTVDEMDERERVRQEEERREDDFNGHLFESNRHDHDRV